MKKIFISVFENPPFDITGIRKSFFGVLIISFIICIFFFEPIIGNIHLLDLVKSYLTFASISLVVLNSLMSRVIEKLGSENSKNSYFSKKTFGSYASTLLSCLMLSAFFGLILFLKDSFLIQFQWLLLLFFLINTLEYFVLALIVSQKMLGNVLYS